MSRYRNLKDSSFDEWNRRQRDLEGQAPIGFSSVTRGGLRIASQEGLTVEGSILGLANNALGKPAHIEWGGTANFTGDVQAKKFRIRDTNGTVSEFNDSGYNFKSIGGIPDGSGGFKDATFSFLLNGSGVHIGSNPSYRQTDIGLGSVHVKDVPGTKSATLQPGELNLKGLPSAGSNPTSYNLLVIDSNGRVHYGPKYSSNVGGDPGDPNTPGTPGGWPKAPFSWNAFALNNLDGESDYGPRNTGKGWHDGIDFSGNGAYDGAPVRAIGPGTVIDPWAYCGGWAGAHPVVIRHDVLSSGYLAGKTLFSVYAHMWTSTVAVGQRVSTGQQVGTVGNDGESYGSHLHLEIHIGSLYQYGSPGTGGSQDPVPILNAYGGWA